MNWQSRAHFEFAGINIELTILRKKFEEILESARFSGAIGAVDVLVGLAGCLRRSLECSEISPGLVAGGRSGGRTWRPKVKRGERRPLENVC
jgi:hypothetical protein